MIKKAAIFLGLVAGGFVALHFATRDDKASDATQTTAAEQGRQAPTGPGIRSQTGEKNSQVTMNFGGKWSFAGQREVKVGGSMQQLPAYQVVARDSRTEPRNKLVLEDVTVTLFEVTWPQPERPVARKAGVVVAKRARLEFSQGQDGAVRPAEDKLMEFWDLVYRAGDGVAPHGLTFKMARARVLNTADRVRLWTPGEADPVEVLGGGDRPFRVLGKGLRAALPTKRDARGNVEIDESGRREVTVLSEPVFTQGRTTMRAAGPLAIVEDAASGTARVTLEDQVVLTSAQERTNQGATGKTPVVMTARGDRLRADLVRTTVDGKDSSTWTRVDLDGDPARLEDGGQLELTAAHLTVFPDAAGEPGWFLASGGAAHPPRVVFSEDGVEHDVRSAGRVHVVRLRRQHAQLLGFYGVPFSGIPAAFDQLILFEDDTRVESASDGLHLTAAGGLVVLRSEEEALQEDFLMRGRGAIGIRSLFANGIGPNRARPAEAAMKRPSTLEKADLRVTGNRGFTLRQQQLGDDATTIVRHLQIGPSHVDGSHRYTVDYEPDTTATEKQRFHMQGTGTCRVRLRAAGIEQIALNSPTDDIEFRQDDAHRVWQLASVLAWFDAAGMVERFIGKGPECRVAFTTPEGNVEGDATEIHQVETRAYRLVGSPAELRDPVRGRLRAQTISVLQLTEQDLQMHAIGEAFLHIDDKQPGRPAGSTVVANLHADEIRVEPFLQPPPIVRLLAGRLPTMPHFGFGDRHLFASGRVKFDFVMTSKVSGAVTQGDADGTFLAIRTDASGEAFADGYLLGTPARMDSIDAENRHGVARADRIDFFVESGQPHLNLHRTPRYAPSIEILGDLRNPIASASADQPKTVLTCEGPIDLRPAAIVFRGPVAARTYDARGAIDPEGLALDAESLVIDRAPDGSIRKVTAEKDIEFAWSGASGSCDALTLDMQRDTMIARGGAQPAKIRLPAGDFEVQRVDYNFRTKMIDCWRGNLGQALTRK